MKLFCKSELRRASISSSAVHAYVEGMSAEEDGDEKSDPGVAGPVDGGDKTKASGVVGQVEGDAQSEGAGVVGQVDGDDCEEVVSLHPSELDGEERSDTRELERCLSDTVLELL